MGRLHRLCTRWKYRYISVPAVLLRVAREWTPAHYFRWLQRRLYVGYCMWELSPVYSILVPSDLIRPEGSFLTFDMRQMTVLAE